MPASLDALVDGQHITFVCTNWPAPPTVTHLATGTAITLAPIADAAGSEAGFTAALYHAAAGHEPPLVEMDAYIGAMPTPAVGQPLEFTVVAEGHDGWCHRCKLGKRAPDPAFARRVQAIFGDTRPVEELSYIGLVH